MKLPVNTQGTDQCIMFPEIANQKERTEMLELVASSNRGTPVGYHVREGPAKTAGNTLHFTAILPRSKFPVKVTVVAWQWGLGNDPKFKAAQLVERTFAIVK